jgi:hypothetical protein
MIGRSQLARGKTESYCDRLLSQPMGNPLLAKIRLLLHSTIAP